MQQQGGLPHGFSLASMQQAAALLQGTGQPGAMQGHALLAQRLAVMPQGARGGLPTGQPYQRAAPAAKPASRKGGGGAAKGRKSCNCKNSKCLKLYCECFASGRYCDNCNCASCFNNKESEAVRQSAVESILERNPNAFRPKIQTAEGDTHPQSIRNAPDGSVRHTKGCNCKKSSCLKKYCECFQGGIFCTEICKCVDCKNFDGSEARAQVVSHHGGDPFAAHHAAAAAAAAMAAAQQQALKQTRPRLVGSNQQAALQAAQAQAQPQVLQQLAAAASAGPAAAAGLQPLQLQGLAAGLALPSPSGGLASAAAAPAGAASAALTPRPPSRAPVLDAVHELVRPEAVEEAVSLLLVMAQEQADKYGQQQQHAGAGDEAQQQQHGLKRKQEGEGQEEGAGAAAKAAKGDPGQADQADGDSMQTDAQPEDQQQGGLSDLYAAQEGAVLAEFASLLQRIVDQAARKAALAEAAGAGDAADLAGMAAGGDAEVGADGLAAMVGGGLEGVDAQQLLLDQQQLEQQDLKPLAALAGLTPTGLSQQQAALAAQQALMLQGNLALLQASRGMFLPGGPQQPQQPLPAALPPAAGLQQLRGLGQGMGMVQVMAQDGTLHQVPSSTLMSLQLAAAGLQQQQQQQLLVPPAAPLAAASAAQPISLLSLLNGGTTGPGS